MMRPFPGLPPVAGTVLDPPAFINSFLKLRLRILASTGNSERFP